MMQIGGFSGIGKFRVEKTSHQNQISDSELSRIHSLQSLLRKGDCHGRIQHPDLRIL